MIYIEMIRRGQSPLSGSLLVCSEARGAVFKKARAFW
jgi:hypothetical protein